MVEQVFKYFPNRVHIPLNIIWIHCGISVKHSNSIYNFWLNLHRQQQFTSSPDKIKVLPSQNPHQHLLSFFSLFLNIYSCSFSLPLGNFSRIFNLHDFMNFLGWEILFYSGLLMCMLHLFNSVILQFFACSKSLMVPIKC